MKIAIGADHAGFEYKQAIKAFLEKKGYEVKDYGTDSAESVDYPDFAHPVSNAVESGAFSFGVLVCGSANGVAITANKHQGIRAAICWQEELAVLARQHNNANIVCIPARFIDLPTTEKIVDKFMKRLLKVAAMVSV
jgi:ribose 5-phosphate isomerase B